MIACWQKQFADAAVQKGLISRWQGTYEAPAPVAEVIQKENAESLLKKLIELNDPRYIPAGFILAVMLERKRILKVKEQIVRDGQRTLIYEQAKSGDVFNINDPNLRLDQLEEVQRDVAALLERGLNPPQTNLGSAETTTEPAQNSPSAKEIPNQTVAETLASP